jgi:hypothetical protein
MPPPCVATLHCLQVEKALALRYGSGLSADVRARLLRATAAALDRVAL